MRSTGSHKLWTEPSVSDKCTIVGWRRCVVEPRDNTMVFPVYHLDGDSIIPTTQLAWLTNRGPLVMPFDHRHNAMPMVNPEYLDSPEMYRQENLALVSEIGLNQLVEAMADLSRGIIKYALWRGKRNDNHEVIVVQTVTPERVKPIPLIYRIKRFRCSESPTGFHVAEGNPSLQDCRGHKPREVDCCRHCRGVFAIDAFPQ